MDGTAFRSSMPEGWERFDAKPKSVYDEHLLKYATDIEARVFDALCHYRWNNSRIATVSLVELARATYKCRKTVIKVIKGLEFLGLIAKRGTEDHRVMRYELLPCGAGLPPNVDEIVAQRSKPPRRKPPRDVKGKFRSQHVEGVTQEASTPSDSGLQDKEDQSTGSGLVKSSGSGHPNPPPVDPVEK